MKALERLFVALDVQQVERRPVVLLWGYSFCLGIAASALLTASNALFLEAFGSAGLPWLYMAIAGVMGATAYAYLKMEEYLAFDRLITIILGLLLVWVVSSRLGLWLFPGRWLLFSLPLLLPAITGLGGLIFWGVAGRLFNLRQGKRLYGVIGTGRWLAAVLLGFAVSVLVGRIGTENLLWVAAAGLIGNLWLAARALAQSQTPAANSSGLQRVSQLSAPSARSVDGYGRRYPWMMGLLMMASCVGYYVAEFVFNDRVATQFADAARLAGFLGLFSAIEGLLNLVIGTFVTGPFIARLGVLAGLLANPLALLACALVMLLASSLWGIGNLFAPAAWTYLLMIVLSSSIDRSAFSVLYQPLPASRRGRVQTVIEGIIQQAVMGLIGLALLFVNLIGITLPGLLVILVLAAAAWAGVAWQVGSREYPGVLQKALARRALDGLDVSLADAASVALLERGLKHAHPAAVLYALHTLERIDPQLAVAALPELLRHADPQVRFAAWAAVERLRPPDLAALAVECLAGEADAGVLGAGLRALASVDGRQGFQLALRYLECCQPETRLGALVALVRYGSIEGVLAAGQLLLRLVESPESEERALAATALGEIGVQTFYQPLLPLLRDQALEVRRAALRSTGKLKAPELWPLVVQAVCQRGTRRPAQQALAAAGVASWDALQSALDWQGKAPDILCRLLSAVGLIGGERAVNLLVEHVGDENVRVRSEVLQQLFHLAYRASAADAAHLRQQIYAEAERAAWLLASWRDTGDGPDAMLRSAYLNCLAQLRLRLLNLLSFLYDLQTIRRIRYNLVFGSAAERAVALEVIETLVGREVGAYVLPILDDLPPELALARLGTAFSEKHLRRQQRLEALLKQAGHELTAWAGACALYTVGKERLQDLSQAALACLDASDALLREMAAWALYRLGALPDSRHADLAHDLAPAVQAVLYAGGKPMLSTVEKVIFLKTVSSFAAMPDDALADVALLLDEQEVIAGERIIEKGEAGDSMYIVVDGRVRVHNDHVTLNYLGAGDVFGELAVLASEPRSASVTAEEDSLLLRLEQYELYELMEYRSEVAHGIIQVLTRHLRARTRELADLRREVEQASPL